MVQSYFAYTEQDDVVSAVDYLLKARLKGLYHHDLGWRYLQLGQLNEAQLYLEDAIRREPLQLARDMLVDADRPKRTESSGALDQFTPGGYGKEWLLLVPLLSWDRKPQSIHAVWRFPCITRNRSSGRVSATAVPSQS